MTTDKTLPDILKHERVLNTRQAAQLYNVSIATWRREYEKGKLPPAIRVSERRLGWRVKDLVEHLAKRADVAA